MPDGFKKISLTPELLAQADINAFFEYEVCVVVLFKQKKIINNGDKIPLFLY